MNTDYCTGQDCWVCELARRAEGGSRVQGEQVGLRVPEQGRRERPTDVASLPGVVSGF